MFSLTPRCRQGSRAAADKNLSKLQVIVDDGFARRDLRNHGAVEGVRQDVHEQAATSSHHSWLPHVMI